MTDSNVDIDSDRVTERDRNKKVVGIVIGIAIEIVIVIDSDCDSDCKRDR